MNKRIFDFSLNRLKKNQMISPQKLKVGELSVTNNVIFSLPEKNEHWRNSLLYPSPAKASEKLNGYRKSALKSSSSRTSGGEFSEVEPRSSSRTSNGEFSEDGSRPSLPVSNHDSFSKNRDNLIDEKNGYYPWVERKSRMTDLPRYLRGSLEEGLIYTDKKEVLEICRQWLTNTPLITAFTGIDEWGNIFPEVQDHQNANYLSIGKDDEHTYVYYQQWYQPSNGQSQLEYGWPIYHSKISIQLARSDTRVAARSSYFPIPDSLVFTRKLNEKGVRILGRKILTFFEDNLMTYENSCSVVKAAKIPIPQKEKLKWDMSFRTYCGSRLFILPYDGEFFLVFELILTSSDNVESISIFIDSETGVIIGKPYYLNRFSCYFSNSYDALNNKMTSFSDIGQNPSHDSSPFTFTGLNGQQEQDLWNTGGDCNSSQILEDLDTSESLDSELLKIDQRNIAVHSQKLYVYLSSFDIEFNNFISDINDLNSIAKIKEKFTVGFSNSTKNSFVANFTHPSKEAQGLATLKFRRSINLNELDNSNSLSIVNPTRDPEIIYHEFTHALMWLIYPLPFNHHPLLNNFNTAITEGFANYFARSLGVQNETIDIENDSWAKAAYRESSDWGNRWSFTRNNRKPGQDLLSTPNSYPSEKDQKDDLHIYDAGMILGRVLWDIRNLIGRDLADKLALKSYGSTLGWMDSFEMLAEGLIDVAHSGEESIEDNRVFSYLFKKRGILADTGIQALEITEDKVFVGGDEGLFIGNINNNEVSWGRELIQLPIDRDTNSESEGIVDISSADGSCYILSEKSVYIYERGECSFFCNLRTVIEGQPLSIEIFGNKLFVGASDKKIYIINIVDASIREFNKSLFPQDMCSSQNRHYFIGGSKLYTSKNNEEGWSSKRFPSGVISECMCQHNNTIFIGSKDNGIYTYSEDTAITKVNVSSKVNEETITSIATADGVDIYASTTSTIYQIQLDQVNAQNTVREFTDVDGLPDDCVITKLASYNQFILAGTAIHGVYQLQSESWKKCCLEEGAYSEKIEMMGNSIKILSRNTSHPISFKSQIRLGIFPFKIQEDLSINIEKITQNDQEVTLFSFSKSKHIAVTFGNAVNLSTGMYAVVTNPIPTPSNEELPHQLNITVGVS